MLFAFLTFIAIPAMDLVHSFHLEKGSGVASPPRWPPQVDWFVPAAIFAVAFLVGLLVSFRMIPGKAPPPRH